MKRLIAFALLGAATAAVAQPAYETETGSRLPIPKRAQVPDDRLDQSARSRMIMAEFARCVVDRQPGSVARALAQPFGEDYSRAISSASTGECMEPGGMMTFASTVLRGPLFTELYRRRSLAQAKGATWGPTFSKVNLAVPLDGRPNAELQYLYQMYFADCIARQDRRNAEQVVLAKTMSPEQDAAIAAIIPKISACVPQGQTMRLNKQVIEGVLAEVLYRGVEPLPAQATAAAAPAGSK